MCESMTYDSFYTLDTHFSGIPFGIGVVERLNHSVFILTSLLKRIGTTYL